ncbi:MAG: Transketolase central region [Candidatus Beckwithbacteria bacterium GW2011_GWA2_43_10]|uniref:Transketolase central region n=1 Tax=Candidatus Beckwithbacteria bacterium GW2011_GWA2_43_10 TaxID=1618369 RepID=A0A0G1C3P0_9BACT|nr:MAG: Transketolase central region [Candidatus Beckwithbacteria bacterium GW2011_GWA2_43_10]
MKFNLTNPELKATREGYGEGLLVAGLKNPQVVALTADLTESTKTSAFKAKFPNRFFNLGVAEQNLIGVAAGMALSGKIPFASSFAVFSPGRSWEQIRLSVCYQQANVKIVGTHAGVTTGPDGATHQALEDIAITRCLPNLTVISPCDYHQAIKATLAAAEHQGPVYLRLFRDKTPVMTAKSTEFVIAKAQIFQKGTDITLVSIGPLTFQALLAAENLQKERVSTEVINLHTIKPLDLAAVLKSVQKTNCLVTVEEHQVMGGMGSAVVEALAQAYAVPVTEMIGIKDSFGESGQAAELLQKFDLGASSIVQAAKKALSRKRRL